MDELSPMIEIWSNDWKLFIVVYQFESMIRSFEQPYIKWTIKSVLILMETKMVRSFIN